MTNIIVVPDNRISFLIAVEARCDVKFSFQVTPKNVKML